MRECCELSTLLAAGVVFSNPEMSLKGGFEAGSFRRLLPGDFLTSFSS
jgi:hypothetical protein